MATSQTAICNLALARLGATRIADMADELENARVCRLFYEEALKELLRMAPWSFAIQRAELAESVDAPEFGWAHQFPLPSDCVQVLECNDLDAEMYAPTDFAIENRHVLTDDATAKIRYVALANDPGAYPSDFTEALALLLASKIAVPITGNPQLAAMIKAEFEAIEKPRASRQNGNESRQKRRYSPLESDLVRARFTRNS